MGPACVGSRGRVVRRIQDRRLPGNRARRRQVALVLRPILLELLTRGAGQFLAATGCDGRL